MKLLSGVHAAVAHALWYLDWRTGGKAVRDAAL
jgi:hypothetical protein